MQGGSLYLKGGDFMDKDSLKLAERLGAFDSRQNVINALACLYGAGSFYSKFFSDHPAGEIFFHKQTGFSIGHWLANGKGYVSEPSGLQATYLKTEVSK